MDGAPKSIDPPTAHPSPSADAAREAEDVGWIARRAKERDPVAFTQLIRRFERTALSIAYGALGNAEQAGDVAQESFVRAWERIDSLNDPERFGAWLSGIVRNLATDVRRRRRLAPRAATDLSERDDGRFQIVQDRQTPTPPEALTRQEQRGLVTGALASLDDATRTVVSLRYYDNLSSREIGDRLDLSPAAVDMRLSRARQQLRRLLESNDAASE